MSTSKFDTSGVFQSLKIHSPDVQVTVPASSVRFRKNGIEFTSPQPFSLWAEMTVEFRSPLDGRRLRGVGVVVESRGNRHAGYLVSLLFMNLTAQSQEHMAQLALAKAV